MFENNIIQISTRETTNISLRLYYCGCERCSKNQSWGPKVTDHFLIYYIYKGQGIIEVNSVKYQLHKGQGFLISPNTVTCFTADSDEPWKYAWVGFTGNIASEYLNRANLSVESPIFTDTESGFLEQSFDNLIEFAKIGSGHNRYCKMMSVLYNIIAHLIDISNNKNIQVKHVDENEYYVRKALDFIDMNFSKEISIAEISNNINIDRKYLHYIFKNTLNISPQKYVINYRIKKACELMENSRLSISDISRSVGYKDQFQFSKMFKKTMGISPSHYRNNVKNTDSKKNESKDKMQLENLEQRVKQKDMEINELKKFVNDNYVNIIIEKE